MTRHQLLAVCALGFIVGSASAQPPRGGPVLPARPAVSPYLNLLRPGNSPGVNYYGLVRPQLEFRGGIQNLQQQITTNQTQIADINTQMLPVTGHRTTFLNTGGYFSGGAPVAGAGGARPGSPPTLPQPARPASRR